MKTYNLKKKYGGLVLKSESGKEIRKFKNIEEALIYIDAMRKEEDLEITFTNGA